MRLGYFAMPLHPPGSDPAQTKLRGFDMLKVDPAMPDAEVTLDPGRGGRRLRHAAGDRPRVAAEAGVERSMTLLKEQIR